MAYCPPLLTYPLGGLYGTNYPPRFQPSLEPNPTYRNSSIKTYIYTSGHVHIIHTEDNHHKSTPLYTGGLAEQ